MQGVHLTAIGDGIILLEPADSLDPSNEGSYLEPLLEFMQEENGTRLVYDLKDVPLIDQIYYTWLKQVHTICQISGVEMIVVNMQPTAAFSLAKALDEHPPFDCAIDVDQAR